MYDSYAGMIIPLLVDASGVFIMKNFFESIPPSVEEQARIDGAGTFRTFWSIVLPMAAPAVITITIMSFQGSWNELSHFIVSTQSMELTTLTRGDISLYIEEFDPTVVLEEVVASTQGRPTGVELRVAEAPPFMPRMKSDRKKIARILASLLGNAYKFTPRGHVDVGVTLVGDRVQFGVADTGIGIPPEA